MTATTHRVRYRAASMAFVADLETRLVEMRFRTPTDERVSIICNGRAVFSIKRHIDLMVARCPEMTRW